MLLGPMGHLSDLVDRIERETQERNRIVAERARLVPEDLERDTNRYLEELRAAVLLIDDSFDEPIDVPPTALDAFRYLALSYGGVCRELSDSVRRALTTKSTAEYAKAAGTILAIDESRTMHALMGLRYLNTMYFPDIQMRTYLDSSAELVRRTIDLFQDPGGSPISG
jgi:hypothetical protein